MNKNKESTRFFSNIQEQKVAKLLGGNVTANSGATHWRKGDVQIPSASLLCECKTVMQEKKSFSIQRDWVIKNKDEAFSNRLSNTCIAFSFDPDAKDIYFVINEKLMKFLVEKLSDDNT